MNQAPPTVKCIAPNCTAQINPAVDAVCAPHQKLVPPYWLKRWKKADAHKAAAKTGTTRDRFNALREVEFVRGTIIGACQRVQP